MRDEDESPPGTIWEWQAPLVLLIVGLVIQLVLAFTDEETAGALVGLVLIMVVYVPLTIVAMYVVAALLKISFGLLKTAILKLAAITLFTGAINQAGNSLGSPFLGWLVAVVVSWFLFSYFFDLDARETFFAVILISIIRLVLAVLVAALLAMLMGDERELPEAQRLGREHDLASGGRREYNESCNPHHARRESRAMSTPLNEVLQAALALPEADRLQLVDTLIATLGPEEPDDDDSWPAEVDRRYRELEPAMAEPFPWQAGGSPWQKTRPRG